MPCTRRSFQALILTSLLPALSTMTQAQTTPPQDDPYLWLENVQGDQALAWVRERNAASRKVLEATPGFDSMRQQIRSVLDSRDRIPNVVRRGDWL